ncbi:MAG: hypothetical protein PVI48_11705, partial [Gammaproteobacteria bacterium]
MNAVKYTMACTLVLFGAYFSSVLAAPGGLSKVDELPPSLEQKVRNFESVLQAEGYEVLRGHWSL